MQSWVKTIDDFSSPETYITPYYTIKSHGQEESFQVSASPVLCVQLPECVIVSAIGSYNWVPMGNLEWWQKKKKNTSLTMCAHGSNSGMNVMEVANYF